MSVRQLIRQVHSKAGSKPLGPRIYLSKDEKCFVSYHPAKDHPYESTRPMPVVEKKDESFLKVNSLNMITKAPNLEQVQNLTYTPRSYWRQDAGKAKRDLYKKYFDEKDVRRGLTS